jgi:hypothetical protein
MALIELAIILIVPLSVLGAVLYLTSASWLKKHSWARKLNSGWPVVERAATLAGILSLWVAVAAYSWSEHEKEEKRIDQYQNLIADFESARSENLATIEYVQAIGTELYRANPDKLAYLDTFHVQQLIQNDMVSGSSRVINLIRLNTHLALFNEKLELMKSFNMMEVDPVQTAGLFIRLAGINGAVDEIRSLYRAASEDLSIEGGDRSSNE